MIRSTGWRPSLLAGSVMAVWGAMPEVSVAASSSNTAPANVEAASRHCAVEHFVANAADRAFALHDYAKAERLYRAMLTESPETATAGVARSELGQWKLDEALETAQVAIALQPKSARLMDVLGEV